jgi:hypothetical protein
MKKSLFISLMLYVSAIISGYGCNTNSDNHRTLQDIKKETRNVDKFKSIGLSVAAELILVQGSPQSVELEGDPADLEKIITDVDGTNLEIKHKSSFSRIGKIKIYITVPDIEGLAVSGSGSITSNNPLKTGNLSLAVSGSGKIQLNDLEAKSISSAVSGSGKIELIGKNAKVDQQDIAISGSGDVFAENLETQTVKVAISGSGTSKVYATRNLEVGISGSGKVYYRGDPKVDAGISGSGKVITL